MLVAVVVTVAFVVEVGGDDVVEVGGDNVVEAEVVVVVCVDVETDVEVAQDVISIPATIKNVIPTPINLFCTFSSYSVIITTF